MPLNPLIKLALAGDSVGCENAEPLGLLAPFESMVSCGVTPLFTRNYTTDPSLGDNATFARTSAATLTVSDGTVGGTKIADIAANEARFEHGRRVANLLREAGASSEDLQVGWTGFNSATINSATTFTTGASNSWVGFNAGFTPANGRTFVARAKVAVSANCSLRFRIFNATASADYIAVTAAGGEVVLSDYLSSGFVSSISGIQCNTNGVTVTVTEFVLIETTGNADPTIPSSYSETHPDGTVVSCSVGVVAGGAGGSGVDGVYYSPYANGNSVASNVVTELQGALITNTIALLMEPAATNEVQQSTAFDTYLISKYGGTVISDNAAIAPNGSLTASLYTTTSGGANRINALVGAQTFSFSCFIKAGSNSLFRFGWQSQGEANGRRCNVDLTAGTVEMADLGAGTFVTGGIASISALNDNWYKVEVSGLTSIGNVELSTWTGGAGTAYLWQLDLQGVSVITSPISTSGAAVARDICSLSYSGIPASNETRAVVDGVNVDVDNWDGVVDTTLLGADGIGRIESITVYNPGERPA